MESGRGFFFLVLICFNFSIFADNWQQSEIHFENGDRRYLTVRAENSVWIGEAFYQRKGEFQFVEHTQYFSNRQSAMSWLYSYIDGVSAKVEYGLKRTGEPIWVATQAWSDVWEQRYTDWVKANLNGDFFYNHGIATDCADVALATRWIFSRINGLPMGSSLAATGKLFSNLDLLHRWQNLPTAADWSQDQRFRAALNYVLSNANTHTLMRDSYPVKMDAQGLDAGTYYLYLYSNTGHTQLAIGHEGRRQKFLTLMASTTPRDLRKLDEYALVDTTLSPKDGNSGFFRIRWTQLVMDVSGQHSAVMMPKNTSNLYSTDEFNESLWAGFSSFIDYAYYRLNGKVMTASDWIRGIIDTLKTKWLARVAIVEQGYQYCSRQPNGCPYDSAGYDAYGTPSRDNHLYEMAQRLYAYLDRDSDAENVWRVEKRMVLFSIGRERMTIERLFETWFYFRFSSDPNDSIPLRWGIL